MTPFAYFWRLVHTGTDEQINSGLCLHPDLPPSGPDDTPGFEYVATPLYKESPEHRWITEAREAMRQALKGDQRGYNERQATAAKMAELLSAGHESGLFEIAGYVDPAHLRDLKPRWDNAIQLTKDCEHGGMIPLFRWRV